MRVPRIPCLVAACSVALGSFSAFPVFAASVETYTLSYAETAALFGYTAMRVENPSSTILAYDYSDSSTVTYHAPHMWYANYELDGVPYIGIRVYINKEGISAGRGNWSLDVQITTSITLENMYDFSLGAGFLTSYMGVEVTGDELWVKYSDNGVIQTQTTEFTTPYTLQYITNIDSGSRSSCTVVGLSPITSTLPVYDLYYSVSTYPHNFRLRISEPTYNALSEPYQPEYYSPPSEGYLDGYTYIFLRCPTITVDADVLDDISAKLDTAVSTMEGIQDMLTSSPEQDAAISDRVSGIETGSQLVGDYNAAESSLLTEISLYNPSDYYVYDGDSTTWFGHFWRFVERMPFVMTFSSVGIMFAVLSYVLYGRK